MRGGGEDEHIYLQFRIENDNSESNIHTRSSYIFAKYIQIKQRKNHFLPLFSFYLFSFLPNCTVHRPRSSSSPCFCHHRVRKKMSKTNTLHTETKLIEN